MTKNRLSDLNDHLFAQLERLADEGMTDEQIKSEAMRASAIVNLADQITGIADLQLRAAKIFSETDPAERRAVLDILPQMGRSNQHLINGGTE